MAVAPGEPAVTADLAAMTRDADSDPLVFTAGAAPEGFSTRASPTTIACNDLDSLELSHCLVSFLRRSVKVLVVLTKLAHEAYVLLALDQTCGELGRPPRDEVGDEANQKVAKGKLRRVKAEGRDTRCDAQVDKDLTGIDVRKDAAVGVIMIRGSRVVGRPQ